MLRLIIAFDGCIFFDIFSWLLLLRLIFSSSIFDIFFRFLLQY